MSGKFSSDESFELERYELRVPSLYHFELDRREFFKLLGSGVVVVMSVGNLTSYGQESGRGRQRDSGSQMPEEIGAWLHIGEDSKVTVYTGKTEVGQNIRTSLAQAVSEELHIPTASIQLVMADTDLTPFDRGTFGSRTTPAMSLQLRKVAATTREILIDLAAERLKVDRNQLVAQNGKIINSSTKQSFNYSELIKNQKILKAVNDNVALIKPEQWKVMGTSQAKMDARAFVTGKHKYASDIKLPGMLYGKILRGPAAGSTLDSVDISRAEVMPNVKVVRDGNFVGVAAPDSQTAEQAIKSIKAIWKPVEEKVSGKTLFEHLRKSASEGTTNERGSNVTGSVKDGLAESDVKIKEAYTIAYIAHAPLEPRAAVAEWKDGKLTVWTGTQRPFGVRQELAEAFRIEEKNVRVIVPDTGSGYGGSSR
jgi:nicotinate dehydrogenase subunit B